ncbi:hypothetical protein JHK87_055345 [Glycine soja]|nr:hypothetical protein JHK87_055345 [Glycine soja]
MTAAPCQPHSHSLPLSQDPYPRPRALTLLFRFQTPTLASHLRLDFEPHHQSLRASLRGGGSASASPSRPPSVALCHPHPPLYAKHLSLWLCIFVPPLILFSTLKESINKPVSSGSMSIDENEDKSSHEEMESQFVEPSDGDDLFDEDSIVKTTSSKGASNVVDVEENDNE